MFKNAQWITSENSTGHVCPKFIKRINVGATIKKATLYVTAKGVYEAEINKNRVGKFYLAPGWTSYKNRIQYQTYDITDMLKGGENLLEITVGPGWYSGRISRTTIDDDSEYGFTKTRPLGLIAEVVISYADGTNQEICTDGSWTACDSPVLFSDIYDGEIYDASCAESGESPVILTHDSKEVLIPQEGEEVSPHERIKPLCIFTTPKGERVIDFGQNLTGYIEFTVSARTGDVVSCSLAEVLDKDGNFYTENYRSAKAKLKYICAEGKQTYRPHFTFSGLRYVRIDEFPGRINPDDFTAVAVYSDMKRTGYFRCSNPLVNRLFENIIWGQKSNFLDIPTDCPQRDEKMGWTGDAQVFARTATYNFDTRKFHKKWLNDLKADQGESGFVPHTIPAITIPEEWGGGQEERNEMSSAAWGDVACICPWQLYLTYGEKDILASQYDSMKKWIDYITNETTEKYLWKGGVHFGDWLGLDAEPESYKGSSDEDLIASAFYAYSTEIVIKAGKVLGEDTKKYEELYKNIVSAFQKAYPKYKTQTEHALALYFNLAKDKKETAKSLAELVKDCGYKLTTGFVGTPYLLHALSDNGYADLAYTLFLREESPSWLYPVKKGATTVWEHWDGIKEDGSFWSRDMNSFNHYAYGAVADWMYGVIAGINTCDDNAGFGHIVFRPIPDKRLDFAEAAIDTKHGRIESKWRYINGKVRYEIITPSPATIHIEGKTYSVSKGHYIF